LLLKPFHQPRLSLLSRTFTRYIGVGFS
jgi:hypothetical protein